jgi:AAA family ATP:ADP antiporter
MVYLSFADAVRRDRLLMIFCAATGSVLLLSRFLVTARAEGESGFTIPLMLFFIAVFFAQGVGNASLGSQVWTIINDIFRPSQGRRLYPIIGTAGTIGGIAGGASIHYLAGSLGTANLVLIWAGATFAIIPLTMWLRRSFGAELRGQTRGGGEATGGRLREGWGFFRSSSMARTLGIVAVMFWIVGSFADFQYTRIMNATFPTEAQLAGYYGIYGMVINISGLAVQIFVSGYLLRRIGVGRGLRALPATILAGFSLVATWFTFWPGLLLRYLWDLVGMTIQGNSFHLSINAIPAALRARVRGFIDGVINPLGGIIGGLAILLLHFLFDATDGTGWSDPVTLVGMGFALAWLVAVMHSRRDYLDLIEQNLSSPERRTAMDAIECLDELGSARAIALLRRIAADPDERKRAEALRVLASAAAKEAEADLLAALADPSPQVRRAALRALAHIHVDVKSEAIAAVERVLEQDSEPAVRAEALRCLIGRVRGRKLQDAAQRWLQHPDAHLRQRAVEAVAATDWDHRALLTGCLEDESASVRAAAAMALWKHGASRPRLVSVLETLFQAESAPDRIAALRACHAVGHAPNLDAPRHWSRSPDPVVRFLANAALIRFVSEGADAAGQRQAWIDDMMATLADPAHARRLTDEVLPLIPDLGETASDAILLAAARLPPEQKAQVFAVLRDWFRTLDSRIDI